MFQLTRTIHALRRSLLRSTAEDKTNRLAAVRETCRSSLPRNLVCASVLFGMATGVQAEDLPLTRIVLFTSGLAQFTRSGPVIAGSTIDLTVRLDQVDDILKSLTVFDKEDAIGAVSLPGKAPLTELFRDLSFGPEALGSPTALLNALVGSDVEIAGQVTAKGRVFRVENEETALPNNSGTTTRHRLTLMTDQGLVQAILEEVTALRFSDSQAKAQIERALAGLTEYRAKERRRLSIGFLGEGTRNAAISYVVAAPIWKTAYRLVLPKDGGKARLQGWAVVENLTGGDWKDIELALVSGNPVALRQPLYTAFFADRVELPVTTAARLVPHIDDTDEIATDLRRRTAPAPDAKPAAQFAAPTPPPAQAMRREPAPPAARAEPPVPGLLGTGANAAEAEEASTQLLYRFPAKISLATGHTMMLPFVDRELSAARIWLYQPETAARHPLAAVRVRNDGESGLPTGIVTTYDTVADGNINFVGDAQLPLLPKGTFKIVTFSLDSKTDIRREDKGVVRTELGKAVNGTLTLTTRLRRTIAYEVTAPADEDREIIAEEARREGWRRSSETKDVEETPTRFRYTIEAPKGKTTIGTLAMERIDSQTVVLTTLPAEDILSRIRGLQNESAALKETVAKLSAIVNDINKSRSQRTQLEGERKKITEDQDRIRRNIQSVGQGSDLGRRYLDTLRTQEDRLAEIMRNDAALDNDIAAQRQSAEELARHLAL